VSRAHPYRIVLASRIRSQLQYRTSFALTLLASAMATAIELTEVYVVFHAVPVIGGLDFPAALLLFAIAGSGRSLADLITGQLDDMPNLLRQGILEVLLVRPLPLLAQLLVSDLRLEKLGRTTLALAVLVIAPTQVDVDWTPARTALLLIAPLAAAGIFAALFITAGAVQFFLIDGAVVTNAFVYGGAYAAMYPTSVYPQPLRSLLTFVVPAAFAGYLPTLAILDRPGPAGLPGWLGWCTAPAAALALAAALLAWRFGVRHYRSAGG